MKLIAITGGIGAGKSVVSRIVARMGFSVYDCDSRAKALMDRDPAISQRIVERFGRDCVTAEGTICRRNLAAIVFNDADALNSLNEIVHAAVRRDLAAWSEERAARGDRAVFVETAILYQSELDRMVDEVWEVIAPRELRIERVMTRNHLTVKEVESRINSQDSFIPATLHPRIVPFTNDGFIPLLPAIEGQLDRL